MLNANFKTLNHDQIRRLAPSVFADHAHIDTSSKYGFINTLDIMERMQNEGFMVTKADQSSVRDEGKQAFTKHMLRFRHVDAKPVVNGTLPEIIMFNSHDRSSGFSVEAGLFRLICSNGLVVPTGETFGSVRMRHSKNASDDAIEGVYSVIENVPNIAAQLENMNGTLLTRDEQVIFAEEALLLRWDEGSAPITVNQALSPRRNDDRKTDVYTTLNVLQENLIRGDILGRDRNNRLRRTRAVESINADTKLNKGLYSLAAKMAELKKAG